MARRRRGTKSGSAGWALISASLVFVLVVGFFVYRNRSAKFLPDLCAPGGPSGVLAVAIDATDQLEEAQRLALRDRIISTVVELKAAWRVELWNVAPTSGVPERVGRVLCRPADAKSVSNLTGNPRLAEKAESEFRRDFTEVLDSLLARSSSNASPILETLQAIAVRSFSTPDLHQVASKRILLASDLVQNTQRLSLLGGLVPPQQPKGMTVSLPGVDVDVLFIDRTPSAYGAGALVQWWQDLLRTCGAQLRRVDRV